MVGSWACVMIKTSGAMQRQSYCIRLTRGKAMSMPSTLVSAGVVSMFALVRGDTFFGLPVL